jgi:ketosteroid isomerase-like protein
MRFRSIPAALAAVCVLGGTAAAGAEVPASSVAAEAGESSKLVADPAATEAIAVVERFSAALAAGRIEDAAAHLDPDVIVLESGGIEQSRDEYLSSHARADAEFLKGAQITLQHRRAQASGDLAWIASESRIRAAKGTEALLIDSTETMVLRRTGEHWKIVHIHWSSRRVGGTSASLRAPGNAAEPGATGSGETS